MARPPAPVTYAPGDRAKVTSHDRREYGRVGTVRYFRSGEVRVEFPDYGYAEWFDWDELRNVTKRGRS